MPEIRSTSVTKSHPSSPPTCFERRELFRQLTAIQINTAGLSGPYRSQEETMERVIGNHSAVRELRRVLRRSLVVPRKGPLWNLLLSASMTQCGGDVAQAARLLGSSVRQVRRALDQSARVENS